MSAVDEITTSRIGKLVVVGSSAGGIEALSIFVSTLPTNFPAPIILAQHLDPSRPSLLGTLLEKRATLPVNVIRAHTALRSGEIYVVPPDCYVTINDGYVEMLDGHVPRPKPSVDVLLSSAARAYGDRLIAVILTGSGSDGAAGAIEVKHAGGVVIIQNPQTARFPSMPLALPPTIVDFQADVERIGPLLYNLLTGASLPPSELHDEVLRSILEYLKNRMGIDLRMYKTSVILQYIGSRMLVNNIPTMPAYLNYLKSISAEVDELVKFLLVPATQFFRDPDAFAYLKSAILPELLERARSCGPRFTLRCWMAGCATGEEAYSLAMLITDQLGTELPLWSVKIFATDLNEAMISFARHGAYVEDLLKGVPPEYVKRFFERLDHGYRIAKALRQMVVFGQHDLTRDAPFPQLDLLMCTNVLSYFTPDLQQFVLKRFAFSLFPGGYLFLGKAETVSPPQALYECISKDWKVYRCIGNAVSSALPPGEFQGKQARRLGGFSSRPAGATATQQSQQHIPVPTFEPGQAGHFNELLLRSLPMGIVVVDRTYRILTANGISQRLLKLPTTATEQDFLHAVPGIPYTEVHTAIEAVFQEGMTITLPEVELDGSTGGNGRFVSLSIAPIQLGALLPGQAAISVSDVTDQELQINLEELETTNEELQATNEDLEATNETLNARTADLQEQNGFLESERVHLAEVIERAPLYVMVLRGPNFVVETLNSHYARWLKGQEVLGRPLKDVAELFWGANLWMVDLVNEVYQQDATRIAPKILTHLPQALGESREKYPVYTLVPSHDAGGNVSGVIIYAADECEQPAKEAEANYLDVTP
jgi:two-component system CheB/CheR fusion protein